MKQAINPPNTPLVDQRGHITPEWYRYLVGAKAISDGISDAEVLTIGDATRAFPNSRQLTVAAGELTATDNPPSYQLGLADTGVIAGGYGSASETISVVVDSKGRLSSVQEYALNTDNVAEGLTNLYFTVARARASVSGGTGIAYSSANGIINLADTAVTPGTYGSASQVPIITVDQQGRLTSVTLATIGTGVTSFNTRTGAVTLLSADVTSALGFNPVAPTRAVNTTAPLAGGGDLSADRTLSITPATGVAAGSMSAADKAKLDLVVSGMYTPTATGLANVDGVTPYQAQYLRVGSMVFVAGIIDIDSTAGGAQTQVGLTLPVASNLTNIVQAGGLIAASAVSAVGTFEADTVNDRVTIKFIASSGVNTAYSYNFAYQVV